MYLTIFILLSSGVLLIHGYNYLQFKRGKGSFDWEDNTAESIVGIIISAMLSWVIELALNVHVVGAVLLVVLGMFGKKGVEWLNRKVHGF